MKTTKRNIFIQIFSGIFSALLFLHIGYFLSEKLTLPQANLFKYGELIIFVAYILIFLVFTSLTAILSKTYNFKYLYYSVFGVFVVSITSALAYWYLEDTLLLILFPFVKNLGYPVTAVAKVIQRITTYTIDWFDGYETYPLDETILYESDTIIIFFIITLISIAIYQLYTETEEHEATLTRWRLDSPARNFALGLIFGYGGFSALITILNLIPYEKHNVVIEIIFYILTFISVLLTMSMATFVAPIILLFVLIIHSARQTKAQHNFRQILNPLVILAIFATCYGTYTIYETTMSCF